MKKLLIFAFATLMMVACKHGEANSKEAENVKDSTEVVEARARDIYTQVLSTYADEMSDMEKVKKTREAFLSEQMKHLIASCETIQEETDNLIFDYDYWINAQDYGDLQLKGVKVLSCTGEQAEVEVRFSNFGEERVQTLILTYDKEKQNWFIDDFLDQGKKSFRHYLEHLL